MFFYFWKDFYATVTLSKVQKYHCERCGNTFCFEAVKTATGSGHSPFMLDDDGAARRAKRSAKKRARRTLETEHYPVPCPECGWYQRVMHSAIRARLYKWMLTLGLTLICSSPFAFLGGRILHQFVTDNFTDDTAGVITGVAASIPLLFCGVGLLIGLVIRRWRFDPNERIPQTLRIRLGREMAVSLYEMPLPLQRINDRGEILDPPPEDDWR